MADLSKLLRLDALDGTHVVSTLADLVAASGGKDATKALAGDGTFQSLSGLSSPVTVGWAVTPYNAGTKSSGTFTPALTNGNYQYFTNGGAFTLAAPATDGAVEFLVTNNGSAGTITFSGFTVGANIGDALDTTNGHYFILSIRRINSIATYAIRALQ
jgi:hypothetical protein